MLYFHLDITLTLTLTLTLTRYVLYFHLDSARFLLGMVGVCTASSVAGPYTFVRGYRPDGLRSLDLTLYQEADGHASNPNP